MDKNEIRILIKHCFLMGKNTVQAREWLEKCYGESAPSKSTVTHWYAEFKRGRTSTADAKRTGRPNETTTPDNIQQIHRIIFKDRRVKVREIADILKISHGTVSSIINTHLDMKKIGALWVPRSITIDRKQEREDDSKRHLEMYQRNPNLFLNRFVTMGEAWIHLHMPEDEEPEQRRPKRQKTQESIGKVLVSIFWDAQGIIFIDCLDKDEKMTQQYYAELIERLNAEILKKRPKKSKKILFYQDDGPVHASMPVMAKLKQLNWELISHHELSPDLSPSEYYLLPNLKRWLQGKRFDTKNEIEPVISAHFDELDELFYRSGVQTLKDRWSKCIALDGDYAEE